VKLMVFGTEHKVRSHRLGRRRKKGGSRMPVAPWIVITMVCVLVAAGLTWGFVALLRSGCSGMYRVTVAVAPGVFSTMEDAAQAWEAEGPEVDGECVGVDVREVAPAAASRGIMGTWDAKTLGPRPIAWVPDSQAWAAWVASSEMTAGYVGAEPVVLGQASSVLAVAESTATELGWVGGQPPSWADVLAAAADGRVSLAAANPRTSTEGLVAMLNATSDGAGGFSQEALDAYSSAVEAGTVADDADEQLHLYAESGDPTQVLTVLDWQVEEFNADEAPADPLMPVTPSGTSVAAVATYLVLGGAPWVSASDAGIAERFGAYLRSQVESGGFADAELQPVEDPQAALAPTTPETVGATVKGWQVGRQDLNILFLVDRSAVIEEESVEYGGEAVSAGDAAIRTAVATVDAMESTSRAGLWEFGVGASDDGPWRAVTDIAELTDDHRQALEEDLYDISDDDVYDGGSPLYDALVAAYQYLSDNAVDGAVNIVVVLTNSGVDDVSEPTVDDAARSLEAIAGAATVYTVGLGSADAGNLTQLAEAAGGGYVEAPADGGVLDAVDG
jgi:hypothetical protein